MRGFSAHVCATGLVPAPNFRSTTVSKRFVDQSSQTVANEHQLLEDGVSLVWIGIPPARRLSRLPARGGRETGESG